MPDVADNQTVGGVLVLPGGKPYSAAHSHSWQLANLRMTWLARSLRRNLGSHITVRRVQYRLRGWNSPTLDAVRDAEDALARMRRELNLNPGNLVLIGHSMGARVAAHVAPRDVGGIVALAPWWPDDDADRIPAHSRLLTVHGTADTWTDPRSSEAQTRRARERGVDARWVGIPDAGHYLLRDVRLWHRLTTDFVGTRLQVGTLND